METVEYCFQVRRILPALILLYTLIDSISWLATSSPNASVRRRFTRWVDDWMLKSGALPCTSLELYAARCGVLHSLTSDSDLTALKKARRILYSFRDDSASPLQEVADHIRPREFVAIRIEDFYDAFRIGLANFLEDTFQNPSKRAAFERRAVGHFSYLRRSDVDSALSNIKKA